jgi:uncharacterized membrane protein
MTIRAIGRRVLAALFIFVRVALWGSAICLGLGILEVLIGWESQPVLTTGLLTLLSIPIVRVLIAILEAVRDRDWLTLGSTLAVLAILVGGTLRYAFTWG